MKQPPHSTGTRAFVGMLNGASIHINAGGARSKSVCMGGALIAAVFFMHNSVAQAQSRQTPAYCTAPPLSGLPQQISSSTTSQIPSDTVVISADSANSDPNDPEQILLNGEISIESKDARISAENARFDQRSKKATVDGQVLFESDGLTVNGDDATIDLDNETFQLGSSGFTVENDVTVSRGEAKGIARKKDGKLQLESSTYTSCPAGDNGWLIKADNISLDQEEGIGTARNITLRFKGIPIFYAPAFSFPISDKRKTGLLTPRFDQSDETGFEYRQPFYWNIRPDTDATFVVRAMSDRGTQLQTELRHLNGLGLWTLNQEFIGNDRKFTEADTRHFTRLQHIGGLSENWTTTVDISGVSDRDYFDDLGDTLKVASITHLVRRADLSYTAENHQFRTRFLSFQTVDDSIVPNDIPYKQLPQLTYSYQRLLPAKGFNATFDTEAVYFDRDNSVTGGRFGIIPRLEWERRRRAWFTTVAGSVNHTNYVLDGASSLSRTVPVFSTEAGLFFDRLNEDNNSVLTLEPRLFYLYSHRVDQDDVPVFDSDALDFNFDQLFRENRFSGSDRINDANQLSVALSSRIVTPQGREKFQASIGQILYFQDRTVTLPGDAPETNSSSDIVGELEFEFNKNWGGESFIQWNPNTSSTIRSFASLQYRNGKDRLFNIGHRFLSDEGEFLNASFAWPVHDKWRIAAGWNYSLDEDTSIESVLGLEYDTCCWALRTAARRFITDDGEEQNTAFFIQLVLKGLAPVGQNVTEVLSEAVGGYTYEE